MQSAAAPSRALLQLVRHADTAAAGAAVRLGGGQRQPRRPPADVAARPARRLPTNRCSSRARCKACSIRLPCCRCLDGLSHRRFLESDCRTWKPPCFLYDDRRHLLAIGYNVDERGSTRLYDLLASEARLASFVAIAQGQLPQDSWFSLGPAADHHGGKPVLLSWTGSMFEYLMPMLVMPSYEGTLLDQTCRAAVAPPDRIRQAARRAVGRFRVRLQHARCHFTYQYRAFGVPGLGLKRGLGDDVVIAPYATVMAMMVAPAAATAEPAAPGGAGRGRALTASTRPSTTPRCACRGPDQGTWCARSWPTTRA
jgi:hypothetical protein